MSQSRFERHLPLASALILKPGRSLLGALLIAAVLAPFSIHYALASIITWLAILAFYVDRRFLNFILLPPFAVMVGFAALGMGIGVALIAAADPRRVVPELLTVQLVFILTFPFAWLGYWCVTKSLGRIVLPLEHPTFQQSVLRPLYLIGWVLLLWRVGQLTVLAGTGAEDRGDYSLAASEADFGIWSYFKLFQRFNSLGFFFVPILWQRSSLAMRGALAGILGFYFLVAFATGARGNVFYPLIYIGVGIYLFRMLKSVKLDVIGAIMVVCILPMIVFMNYYRNTDAYKASRTLDIDARLRAVSSVDDFRTDSTGGERAGDLAVLGGALLGVSDVLVYRNTPSVFPHVGFDGFSGIIYTWVPTFIARNKPILYDANFIVADYVGYLTNTGSAFSIEADAYRRFGWFGVPIFTFLSYLFVGLFTRYTYLMFEKKNAFLGILLIVFTFSFATTRPIGTVLTTWWWWAYDIPKHLVLVFGIYWFARVFLYARTRRGAVSYARELASGRVTPVGVEETRTMRKPRLAVA